VNYAVAKMVSPYTHGMEPKEVRSATNAAVQAIKEAMAALKVIEDVTARVISATCHPALLDPEEEQPKPKKGEPYPLHPKPDEAMGNVAKAFAEVIGLEKKRVAAYKNHIKTAKKRKKKLAVPASSMPLSELKGNQVIRTILEMSDDLRPVLDKIGIGPNSKKEQLEELKKDPIFKSLRSMSAKMKRSAFGLDGLDGLDGLGGLGGDDEDEDSTGSSGPGEKGKSEFIPPPEPPQEQSHMQYQYPQHPRQNGAAGMYPHPLDLYTDQNQSQAHRTMGANGPWYPNQYPMVPNYPPHPMMMHPSHMTMTGPLAAQKTKLVFGFLEAQDLNKIILISIGIVVVYLLVCAFLSTVVKGKWFLCWAYDKLIEIIFNDPSTRSQWQGGVDATQAADMVTSKLKEDQNFMKIDDVESILADIRHAIQKQDRNDEFFTKFRKGGGFDDGSLQLIIGKLKTENKSDAITEALKGSINGVVNNDNNWDHSVEINDAMLRFIPGFLHIESTRRYAMVGMFMIVVAYVFFWFFGARKRFFGIPLLVVFSGFILSNPRITDGTAEAAQKAASSIFSQNSMALLTAPIIGLLTAIVQFASGASTGDAIATATGTMAMSLQDEVERRRKLMEYERTMEIQMKMSDPALIANAAMKGLDLATSAATSSLLPWVHSAKRMSNAFMGYH
jgi:hypothetical protein